MANEILTSAQNLLATNESMQQWLKALPHPHDVGIILDENIKCCISGDASSGFRLVDKWPTHVDFSLSFGHQTIRRWTQSPPRTLSELLLSFSSEWALGHSKVVLNKPLSALKDRGYIKTWTQLAPHLQTELTQRGLVALMELQKQLSAIPETAKGLSALATQTLKAALQNLRK